jgi:hypothetical protein
MRSARFTLLILELITLIVFGKEVAYKIWSPLIVLSPYFLGPDVHLSTAFSNARNIKSPPP